MDGGVFANNPAMVSYVEVSKTVFGPKDGPKDKAPKDLLIISMGSGRSNRKKFPYNKSKRFGMINWVLPVLDVILSGASDVVDTEMWNLFKIAKKPGNYKRINPPLHYSVKPNTDASPENITNLIKDAGAYIEQNREFLDDLANRIVEINGLIKV